MKTHSGAKKRFKVTGTGKITHRSAGKRHLNEHKSSRAMRRLMPDAAVTGRTSRRSVASSASEPTRPQHQGVTHGTRQARTERT